jgi:phosphatidylglycerol:prolipoprotein diacylglycerol transferase
MLHISTIYWDPNPEIFTLPMIHYPILWYGVFFAAGFIVGFPIFVGILTRYFTLTDWSAGKKVAVQLTDRLTVYVVIATLIGARLGHILFYENLEFYWQHPGEVFAVWKGGLASHGALIAIVVALWLFAKKHKEVSFLGYLDFISVPTALAGAFIRIGNFFNQEILGTPTNVPWAVVFGHPADLSQPVPRHPAQIYEALFYLVTFALLWWLSFKPHWLTRRGRIFGLFLILVFGFRFFVEFYKVEQSRLINSDLTMGQWLSIPAVLVGVWFCIRRLK